jgi:hypothetical protein
VFFHTGVKLGLLLKQQVRMSENKPLRRTSEAGADEINRAPEKIHVEKLSSAVLRK